MKKNLIKITGSVFAYGMGILMLATFFVAICYLAAFIVGPPISEAICSFLDAYVLRYVYISGIILCALGVLNMYLTKTYVFMLDISSDKS